jgi:hypothetical protein
MPRYCSECKAEIRPGEAGFLHAVDDPVYSVVCTHADRSYCVAALKARLEAAESRAVDATACNARLVQQVEQLTEDLAAARAILDLTEKAAAVWEPLAEIMAEYHTAAADEAALEEWRAAPFDWSALRWNPAGAAASSTTSGAVYPGYLVAPGTVVPPSGGLPGLSTPAPSSAWYVATLCPRCGANHRHEECPQVKSIEYHEDGRTIKRVEYFEGSGHQPVQHTVTITPTPLPPDLLQKLVDGGLLGEAVGQRQGKDGRAE